jgi:hypothetical protein
LGKGEKKVKNENEEEGRGHANAHVAFHSPGRSDGHARHTDGDSLVLCLLLLLLLFLGASSHKLIQPRRRNGKWRGELEFRLSLRGGVLLRVTAFLSLSSLFTRKQPKWLTEQDRWWIYDARPPSLRFIHSSLLIVSIICLPWHFLGTVVLGKKRNSQCPSHD